MKKEFGGKVTAKDKALDKIRTAKRYRMMKKGGAKLLPIHPIHRGEIKDE